MTDITQIVSQLLQLGAVVRDGEVPLNNTAELGLEKNYVLHLIIAEKTFNVGPNDGGRSIRLVNKIKGTLGDSCVRPICEATIDLRPLSVPIDRWRRVDMASKTEFAKDRIKETAPLAVIGFEEVELDRNMNANVHGLQHNERSRLGSIEEGIGGAGFRGRRMSRGKRHGGGVMKNRGCGSRGMDQD